MPFLKYCTWWSQAHKCDVKWHFDDVFSHFSFFFHEDVGSIAKKLGGLLIKIMKKMGPKRILG